jgi:hypothetical protein
MMASFWARMRCTRSRTAAPVIATGPRPGAPALPSAEMAVGDAPEMAGVIATRLVGADTDFDSNAGRAKPGVPRARHFGVGVLERGDDARKTRGDDGIGAGRRFSVMRAGLERNVERSAACRRAGTA